LSKSYLFFTPARLPLTTGQLGDETVRSFTDLASVRATLGTHLPDIVWQPAPVDALAHGTVSDGDALYEFAVRAYEPPSLIVSLRSSGRVDSAPFVQRLCDATGWVAFDDRPRCFQPHHPPIPA
jgi:hypothetical protein